MASNREFLNMVSLMSSQIPKGQRPGPPPPMKPTGTPTVPREVATLRCRQCHLEWDRHYPDGSAVSVADEEVNHLLDSGCRGSVDKVSTQVKMIPISALVTIPPLNSDPKSRRDPVSK